MAWRFEAFETLGKAERVILLGDLRRLGRADGEVEVRGYAAAYGGISFEIS